MNCCLGAGGALGADDVLWCRGFYTFVRVWGRHRKTAGPSGGMGPRLGALGHLWQHPQASRAAGGSAQPGPPKSAEGQCGVEAGRGSGTDIPDPKSLTPSREPSAYMKGGHYPCPDRGGTLARGPPGAVMGVRARCLGEEC